jgi:hypothetical protein
VIAAVDLLRHAVDAAKVAAVGDRDAQVAQGPAEGVEDVHRGNGSRMSEPAIPNGEESIDESGRNLTQQEIDKEGASEAPVDPGWKEEDDNG